MQERPKVLPLALEQLAQELIGMTIVVCAIAALLAEHVIAQVLFQQQATAQFLKFAPAQMAGLLELAPLQAQ